MCMGVPLQLSVAVSDIALPRDLTDTNAVLLEQIVASCTVWLCLIQWWARPRSSLFKRSFMVLGPLAWICLILPWGWGVTVLAHWIAGTAMAVAAGVRLMHAFPLPARLPGARIPACRDVFAAFGSGDALAGGYAVRWTAGGTLACAGCFCLGAAVSDSMRGRLEWIAIGVGLLQSVGAAADVACDM